MALAAAAAEKAGLADAWMVIAGMDAYCAAQAGDIARCEAGAAAHEEFAVAEGVIAVCAEAAYLWVCARRPDRANALAQTFHGGVLGTLPRDVNWLMTLQCVLEVAVAVDDRELIEQATHLLAPYEGRAVFDAGAVMFHGTTDDTLARAYAVLGDHGRAQRLGDRALTTYQRIGAQWWRDRLTTSSPSVEQTHTGGVRRVHLHPAPGGVWLVGAEGRAIVSVRGLGYLHELIRRPGVPIAALDLVGAGTGVLAEAGLGEIADRQALAAYRERLRDLDAELSEAQSWSDTGRLEALRTERDALLDEVARATGLGGRPRTTGSSHERARVAVKKAITSALDRIATVDEPLAHHLRGRIHTGLTCRYETEPGEHTDWVLD